jgi:hypothetical protein
VLASDAQLPIVILRQEQRPLRSLASAAETHDACLGH